VPLLHAEIGVEVVGDRVPGDLLPTHALLQALYLGLRRPRDERERRVARVEVGGVGDLVGDEGAAHAGTLRVRPALCIGGDLRSVEGAVDDQLATSLEQVEQTRRAIRALEAVVLLYRHPRHPAALGGERIAGAG
jgi:hypothetical protein